MAEPAQTRPPQVTVLIACGVISWLFYAAFSWLSRDFAAAEVASRPILAAIGLLTAAFAVYLVALRSAVAAEGHRDLFPTILIFAAGFRATLLFTQPFQEIDIYRYLWDGEVVVSGVNPFRYSPQDVLNANDDESVPADLQRLRKLRGSDPAIRSILQTVHFKHLPTVYPTVSQAVFATAVATTPDGANVSTRMNVMKAWLLLFDFGTLCFIAVILKHVGRPIGWSVAYGWCPLVLKEFANSGHLDSIAVFFMTFSVWCVLKAAYPRSDSNEQTDVAKRRTAKTWGWTFCAATALGLAIGAKLFPIVLLPVLFVAVLRRVGWLPAIGVGAVAAGLTLLFLWPMIGRDHSSAMPMPESRAKRPRAPYQIPPPIPPGGMAVPAQMADVPMAEPTSADPSRGLTAFLTQWKMNDFLFLIVIENLTPRIDSPAGLRPWFAVTPESWRKRTIDAARPGLNRLSELVTRTSPGISDLDVPFLVARGVTATVFLLLVLRWSWRSGRDGSGVELLETLFLTLAWFWLLLPTLNPWYWIWALPLVPFARGRAWLAMSGLVLTYYLRFWFEAHYAGQPVGRTPYEGATYFDFVIVWLEFGPWFLWLIGESAWRRWLRSRDK